MHPGGGQGQADLLVQTGGHGAHHGVDAVVDQALHRVVQRQRYRHAVGVAHRVGDGHQLGALDRAHHAGVVAAHHAQADQACAQHAHAAASATTVLTASTTRVTSSSVREGWTGMENTVAAATRVFGRSASIPKEGSSLVGTG